MICIVKIQKNNWYTQLLIKENINNLIQPTGNRKRFDIENSRQAISNFFTYAGAFSKRENVLMSRIAGNTTRRRDLYNFGNNDSNFRKPTVIIKKWINILIT